MNNEDLRVKKTVKFLNEALLELLEEKTFEKISVIDICEKAMINRSTFYTHFEDKYALLRNCMENIVSAFDEEHITENSVEGYRQYYMRVVRDIFNDFEVNRKKYKTLFSSADKYLDITGMAKQILSERLAEKLKKCQQSGIKLPVPIDFLAAFYTGACLNAFQVWIENDIPWSVDDIVTYLDRCCLEILK